MIAVDIETLDPNLNELGDGAIRGDGRILGIGIYGGPSYPHNDYYSPSDPRVKEILRTSELKVFHNGVYDLNWLVNGAHFVVNGKLDDTLTRDYLLGAYQFHYDLDSCCERRGLTGKNKEDTIEAWWRDHGGKGKAIQNLDKVPAPVVAKYCLQDCKATYDLWYAQQAGIVNEGLQEAVDREGDLLRILVRMKKNGIRVDAKRRAEVADKLNGMLDSIKEELREKWSCESLTVKSELRKAWNKAGLVSMYTDKGNESWNADVILGYMVGSEDDDVWTHELPRLIHKGRTLENCLNKFVEGSIVDYRWQGRLHPTFYPTKRDEGGTKTGRFSCQDPNCQQLSAREHKFGKEVRSIFIPEDDHILCSFDYKQIEYINFLHYAEGPAAEQAKKVVATDEKFSYHDYVMQLMGWHSKDQRMDAKMINFGTIYGLGAAGLSERLHKPVDEIKRILLEYHQFIPFAKSTTRKIQNTAIQRGFVRTLGGRRQRLKGISYTDNEAADVKSAYKIVNYLIQGSCADILKKGLIKADKEGILDEVKLHLLVHDENVFSAPLTKAGAEAAVAFGEAMTTAQTLSVPIRIDQEAGPNWGECTGDNWRTFIETSRSA